MACPERYAKIANEKRANIDGTVANPSSPSVRLTALLVETITKVQKITAKNPILKRGYL